MLYQLAYVSLSQTSLSQTLLYEILDVSQRNNAQDEITGILMYHDKLFFQVLEGERGVVENCYFERICDDPRHTSLSLMWANLVQRRTFSDWAMGYVGPEEIGEYTKKSFQSLAYLKSDESLTGKSNSVALELARFVFADFQRRA